MSNYFNELLRLKKEAEACKACRLAATRKNGVFGYGNCESKIVFVGEAPGYHAYAVRPQALALGI